MADKEKAIRFANPDDGINTGVSPHLLPDNQIIDCENMFVEAGGRLQQIGYPEYYPDNVKVKANFSPSGTLTVTNGSTTVTNGATEFADEHEYACIAINGKHYRIESVDSTTQVTLDRAFAEVSGNVGSSDWYISFPVTGVHRYVDRDETTQIFASCAGGIYRWNTGTNQWDLEQSIYGYNRQAHFFDYDKKVYFTNGYDPIYVAETGDGDWVRLGSPETGDTADFGPSASYFGAAWTGIQLESGDLLIAGPISSSAGYYIARSSDNGKTWTTTDWAGLGGGTDRVTGFFQSSTGRVFVSFSTRWKNAGAGAAVPGTHDAYYSDDNGVTWSNGAGIGTGHTFTPPTQNYVGRLFRGITNHATGNHYVTYSDDDGATWAYCANAPAAGAANAMAAINTYYNGTSFKLHILCHDGDIYVTDNGGTDYDPAADNWTLQYTGTAGAWGIGRTQAFLFANDKPGFTAEAVGVYLPDSLTGDNHTEVWSVSTLSSITITESYLMWAWTRFSENATYLCGIRDLGDQESMLLMATYDFGSSWVILWQDNDTDWDIGRGLGVAGAGFCAHLSIEEFYLAPGDCLHPSTAIGPAYYMRYSSGSPRVKRLAEWQARMFAYGDLLDSDSPYGATPDAVSGGAPYTLTYNGYQWEKNALVGARLYPDIASNPGVYYTITANTKSTVVVADSGVTSYWATSKEFQIAFFAPERVRYSNAAQFALWDALDFWDEDTNVRTINRRLAAEFETPQSGLMVLCSNSYSMVLGDQEQSWVRYSGGTDRGSIAYYGSGKIMVVSHDGLSVLDPTGVPQPTGGRLYTTLLQDNGPQSFLEQMNVPQLPNAVAFTRYTSDFISLAETGKSWNNIMFQFDWVRTSVWKHRLSNMGEDIFVVSAFSDDAGTIVMIGCHDGYVRRLFEGNTATEVTVKAVIPFVLSDPIEIYQLHKVAIYVYSSVAATLRYRWNSDMRGWSDWKERTLSVGLQRVLLSGGQQQEGNTVCLEMQITSTGYKEFVFPVAYTKRMKHSEVE